MMRQVTPEEAETWTAMARQYGFVAADGTIALGRYVVEKGETGQLSLEFVTPCPAGLYDEDLRPKTPPILFDRTPAGEIILPGRWWQLTFSVPSPWPPGSAPAPTPALARPITG